MNNNPLQARIQIGKPSEPPANFEKKKQMQVIEETSNRSIHQPQPNNPRTPQSLPKPPANLPKIEVEQLINDPAFYRNLMKYNSKIVSEISADVHKELFESSKDYLKKLAETHMANQMRKEMMDFKISFGDFMKDFLPRQMNSSVHWGDLETLKREMEIIRSNNVTGNNTINDDKSIMLDNQFKELKIEIGELKQLIGQVKENESRLEHKLDSSLANIHSDSRHSIVNPDDHKSMMQKIQDQESIIRQMKSEVSTNQEKIKALESQIDFKFVALEQMVHKQHLDYSVSMTRFNDDQNNYFNKDDVSFSIINPRKTLHDETQMLDMKELSNFMGTGLISQQHNMIAPDHPTGQHKTPLLGDFDGLAVHRNMPEDDAVKFKKVEVNSSHRQNLAPNDNSPQRMTQNDGEGIARQPARLNESITKRMRIRKQDLETSLVDVTLNNNTVEEILIDEHGFVVDHNGFPILDDNGNLIKLTGNDIESLRKHDKEE